jgi:hypothetical protein
VTVRVVCSDDVVLDASTRNVKDVDHDREAIRLWDDNDRPAKGVRFVIGPRWDLCFYVHKPERPLIDEASELCVDCGERGPFVNQYCVMGRCRFDPLIGRVVTDVSLVWKYLTTSGKQKQGQGCLMPVSCSTITSITVELDSVTTLTVSETGEFASFVIAIECGAIPVFWHQPFFVEHADPRRFDWSSVDVADRTKSNESIQTRSVFSCAV